jgi:hypothetical protein
MMKTVLGIPSGYKQRCEIVINDRDLDVALRNAVILLLAMMFPDGEVRVSRWIRIFACFPECLLNLEFTTGMRVSTIRERGVPIWAASYVKIIGYACSQHTKVPS